VTIGGQKTIKTVKIVAENVTLLYDEIVKIAATRLLSNLRQTTRKFGYLVRRGNFRSLDNNGGYTIRSVIVKNPMLHANFLMYLLWNRRYCRSKFYIVGIGIFGLFFCSCYLDLDPTTFIYQLIPYPLKMYPRTKNKLSTSKLSKVIVFTYRQTAAASRMVKYIAVLIKYKYKAEHLYSALHGIRNHCFHCTYIRFHVIRR